jgi:hypothetical protein
MNHQTTQPKSIRFRAIAMMSTAYEGCAIRVGAQGLRWLSRNGRFGAEIVVARNEATGARLQFEIGRHVQRKGVIENPTPEVEDLFNKLAAAGVLNLQ